MKYTNKTFEPLECFFCHRPPQKDANVLTSQNQTLWLPKSLSSQAQTCNNAKQGYLVEVANSQKQIKFYLVKSDLPTSLPRLSSL